jgi:hypothetical protein
VSSAEPGIRNGAYAAGMNDAPTTTADAAAAAAAAPATADEYIVYLRLAEGERLQAGSFTSEGDAHEYAGQLMAASATGVTRWPRVGDRYLRPESIVSIDVERSNQPRWTGSTGRATSWGQQGA